VNAGTDPGAVLNAISCWSAGNCTAAGDYRDSLGIAHAMVASETAGAWAHARELALPTNASKDPGAVLNAISCWRAGNCTAVGDYVTSSGIGQAMVLTETSGTWARASALTPPVNAGTGPSAVLNAISCSSTGSCGAVGQYEDSAGNHQAMVVSLSAPPIGPRTAVTS
jgi:hypothetical protein